MGIFIRYEESTSHWFIINTYVIKYIEIARNSSIENSRRAIMDHIRFIYAIRNMNRSAKMLSLVR